MDCHRSGEACLFETLDATVNCRQTPGPSIVLAGMGWCGHRLRVLRSLALPGFAASLPVNSAHALDFEPLGADRGLNAQVITALRS